jgi:tRNA dimethylallyltransferase
MRRVSRAARPRIILKKIAAILVAGPTASGKSALALRLAQELGGLLINTDSMQVYRDLRILTARPSPAEEALAPHRLLGHVDGAVNHSVGLWLADAGNALDEARRARLLPIFVGGTGLYFKALTQGISAIPTVPDEVRAAVRQRALGVPVTDLHAELARRDPETASRLRPTDPQRTLRALEVLEATGRSLASFQAQRAPPLLAEADLLALFLAPERAWLRTRIDQRFDAMLDAGALEEVAALKARRLNPTVPVMRAHGVPHLCAHLDGALSLADAAARSKLDTTHYVKRQFTFARHQLGEFRWVAPEDALAAARQALLNGGRR